LEGIYQQMSFAVNNLHRQSTSLTTHFVFLAYFHRNEITYML
jgi:hypothetical protein